MDSACCPDTFFFTLPYDISRCLDFSTSSSGLLLHLWVCISHVSFLDSDSEFAITTVGDRLLYLSGNCHYRTANSHVCFFAFNSGLLLLLPFNWDLPSSLQHRHAVIEVATAIFFFGKMKKKKRECIIINMLVHVVLRE